MDWTVENTKKATIWCACIDATTEGWSDRTTEFTTFPIEVESRPHPFGQYIIPHEFTCPNCGEQETLAAVQSTFVLRDRQDYTRKERRRIRYIALAGSLLNAMGFVPAFALSIFLIATDGNLIIAGLAGLVGGFFLLGSIAAFSEVSDAKRALFEVTSEKSPGYGDKQAFNAVCEAYVASEELSRHNTHLPYGAVTHLRFDVLKGYAYSDHDMPCYDASSYESGTGMPRADGVPEEYYPWKLS